MRFDGCMLKQHLSCDWGQPAAPTVLGSPSSFCGLPILTAHSNHWLLSALGVSTLALLCLFSLMHRESSSKFCFMSAFFYPSQIPCSCMYVLGCSLVVTSSALRSCCFGMCWGLSVALTGLGEYSELITACFVSLHDWVVVCTVGWATVLLVSACCPWIKLLWTL